MKLQAFFLIIILALGAIPSHALVMGGQNAASHTCPDGTAFPDGCPGAAPDGNFQQPNAFQPGGFFNTTAATPTNYMAANCGPLGTGSCRPPWNVAGVEYPVGYQTSHTLRDPATPNLIPGCTFTFPSFGGGSPTGSGLLTCGGSSFRGDIEDLELGTIGGHKCTALVVNDPAPGVVDLLIKNIHFFNDSALCPSSVTVLNAIFINSSAYTHSSLITQVELDGNSQTYSNIFDPTELQTSNTTNPSAAIATGGTHGQSCTTIQYAYVHDFYGQPIIAPYGGSACINLQYSVVEGWCARGPSCHAEYFAGGGGSAASALLGTRGQTSQYNVILRHWYENAFGPTVHFYSTTWNNPMPIDFISYNHNTQINGYMGKLTSIGSIYGCMGGVPTGGTATNPTCDTSSPNGILYVTQGAAGQGINFSCGGTVISLWQEIPGPYPSGVIDEFEMENPNVHAASSYYPNFTLAGLQCINGQTVPDMTGDAGVLDGHGGNPITQVNIDANYIDASSQKRNTALYTFNNETNPPTFTGSASGTSLTSTSTLTLVAGESIVAPTLGNCSLGDSSCPTVVTGGTYQTGASIPITPSVSPVSNIAMAHNFLGTITTVSGASTFTSDIDLTLQAGESIIAPSISGCGSTNLACPVAVTTGTYTAGTAIAITPSVPAIGPIAMSHQKLSSCTNPVELSGNVSMAPGSPWTDAYMNTLSPVAPNQPTSGC